MKRVKSQALTLGLDRETLTLTLVKETPGRNFIRWPKEVQREEGKGKIS